MERKLGVTYFTKNVRPELKGVDTGSETLTEQSGYVPIAYQVEKAIAAGINLRQQKIEEYDAFVDIRGKIIAGELDIDPTRNKDFDMADYSQLTYQIASRAAERALNVKKEEVDDGISIEDESTGSDTETGSIESDAEETPVES